MSDSRISGNADEVIVDYLRDIRDQLVALNLKFDAMTSTVPITNGGTVLRVDVYSWRNGD